MTFYEIEFTKIRKLVYSNRGQLKVAIHIKNYMDLHYAQDANLDRLSEVGYVSKFHLLRLFKRYYGQTPRQYLTDRRIQQAKVLLKDGQQIADTCFAVGFESPASFSTLFKSRTGQTPSEFRKAQFSQIHCH